VEVVEGLFLDAQNLPVLGSLVAAGLLFAMVVGAVAYGWLSRGPRREVTEREPLRKAA
jgi:hypothetical protein